MANAETYASCPKCRGKLRKRSQKVKEGGDSIGVVFGGGHRGGREKG
jgi:hypothetical protein